MNTADKIAEIIKDQYGNYAGRKMRPFIMLHAKMRTQLGDEKFLEYLEDMKHENPKPKYQPSITSHE